MNSIFRSDSVRAAESEISGAIARTLEWRLGWEAYHAGLPIEACPYQWHRGPAGMFRGARWEAGWTAAARGANR